MKVKLALNPEKYSLFLGIGSNHDFSGCLVKKGRIYRAIEAERINKLKHSFDAFNPFNSVLKYLFPLGKAKIAALASCDTLTPKYFYEYRDMIKLYNHHLCHAAAVYYTSPFEESAVFVADGLGSVWGTKDGSYKYETYSYYQANGKQIKLLGKQYGEVDDSLDETHIHHVYIPNSLGLFYNYITKIIGFDFLDDGKTMGLSAYGNPNKFYKSFIKHFVFKKDGIVTNSFGKNEVEYYSNLVEKTKDKQKCFKLKADIAASCQRVFEEAYFYCLNYLYKKTGSKNLCLSGGIVLNSVANGKIREKTPFENIHYFPGCGDDSIAVGAALLAYYEHNSNRVRSPIRWQTPFLGKNYADRQIELELKKNKIKYIKVKDVYKDTARFIAQGKIVGWFQGASEFGPRALGHRSILVDPRKEKMKDYLNKRVKKRESFRPFAPAILEEFNGEYFNNSCKSPYMLEVFPIKKTKQEIIPAVVHIDGSGRIQTVGSENKEFYKLIKAFYKQTGVPVILNTSFNINKTPIVETPKDAIDCFLETQIDILVIENYICSKSYGNRK